ncbi:hypothetical protein ACFSTA_04850 [Ornithinibacillus salinisoli]|uniref:DUF7847 domain-containing protein n=1 Tax=Ornithinibacillus salinisoli TaxID=1848459 RepID=A0ABW4VWW9_9BACI
MDDQFNKVKGFGEILDQTFRLCKKNFSNFFLIFLIILGPIYLLEALLSLASGTSFFRQVGSGTNWFEQIISGYDETLNNTTTGSDIFLGLLILILTPVAYAAILFAVSLMRNNVEFTAKMVIKKAFSKFWPIFWSSLLFGLILFVLVFALIMIVVIPSTIGSFINPFMGIAWGVLLFLGLGLVIAIFLTRWSFYLCATVLEEDAPGISRSWQLTRQNLWRILGLYVVIILITTIIGAAIEGVFSLFLGSSVLVTIIVDLVAILTSIILAVAYAVIYFDLKVRNDGDDLKEMIDEYSSSSNI